MTEAQVTVSRISSKDVQHRQLIVKLDDEPFATLMFSRDQSRWTIDLVDGGRAGCGAYVHYLGAGDVKNGTRRCTRLARSFRQSA